MEKVLTLDQLKELGNADAPQEWLDYWTGEGIGDGLEGITGETLDTIMANDLLDESAQAIQATYEFRHIACNRGNYTPGRQGKPIQYIVLHYTAGSKTAEGAAQANCIYFGREKVGASAHYFVDDGYTVFNSVDEADTAWHAGNWNINTRSIGIEVCTNGAYTEKEIETLTQLVQQLMAKHGIPASRVIRHFDANGKHCPAFYVDQVRWEALKARLLGTIVTGAVATQPKPQQAPKPAQPASQPVNQIARVQKWVGAAQDGIYGAKTKARLVWKLQTELNAQFGRGLACDGVFGEKTKAACVNVREGAKGNITQVLQGVLICLGYDTGGFDGVFGAKTKAAVIAFQKSRGLNQDGVAGKLTFAALLG